VEILVEGEENTGIVGAAAEGTRGYRGLERRESGCVFGYVIKISVTVGEVARPFFRAPDIARCCVSSEEKVKFLPS